MSWLLRIVINRYDNIMEMISNLGFEYNKSIVEDLGNWCNAGKIEATHEFHQRSQGNESFDRRNEIEIMILGARKLACDLQARESSPHNSITLNCKRSLNWFTSVFRLTFILNALHFLKILYFPLCKRAQTELMKSENSSNISRKKKKEKNLWGRA